MKKDEERIKSLSRKIEFGKISPIRRFDDVLDYMDMYRKNDEYVYIEYEGQKLYAMLDDKDSICEKVLGVSYKQYKKAIKNLYKEWDNEKIKAELKRLEELPTLIERGNRIIPQYKQKRWAKTVKNSIKDLYSGSDAASALEMMEALDENKNFDDVIDILKKGDHSGGSAMSALCMVAEFSDKGPDLLRYENDRSALKISGLEKYIREIERDNAKHQADNEKEIE